MNSEGDSRENESGRPGSEFGPPLEEFGSPGSGFGPPVSEFGPPTGQDAAVRWPEPDQQTDHPELAWRPASEPETTPPPPPQYRAPDSTVFGAGTPPPSRDPYDDDDLSTSETVRHSTAPTDENDAWWSSPTAEGGVPKPPAESPGLSWADDPIARRLQPGTPLAVSPEPRPKSSKRKVVLGAVGAIVVIVALVATIIGVSGGNHDSQADPRAGGSAGSSAALNCPASKDGKTIVGSGVGATDSGADAILGFQYAFYVERNGEHARKFVADDALNVSTAAIIQKGINEEVPVGTTHCLRISEMTPDTYEVDLQEFRPDGRRLYKQIITTVVRDGKHLLYSIDGRP